MTTLVLGHLVLDEIHAWDGSVYHAAGGITFPLGTFSALAGKHDMVLPVFPFGADAREVLRESEDRFPEMTIEHCWEVDQGTTCVRLFHESPAQYNTQLVRSLPPIPRQRYEQLLDASDLVYLNMMTGEDILLSDAALLRGKGRLVYIDLHMIAYRVHGDGKREPAPSQDWKRWIVAGDIVQCNERETHRRESGYGHGQHGAHHRGSRDDDSTMERRRRYCWSVDDGSPSLRFACHTALDID